MSTNIDTEYNRWLECADDSLQEELQNMSENDKKEAFSTSLSFGTAGLRGFIRPGTNAMNIHTVAAATQGLANYLKKNYKKPSVAIARDSRHKGKEFVEVCVGVLVANGVEVYYSNDIESTPGLSFSVRYLHCSAGICVTASHNPSKYNGYKAYGPDGCQITSKAANAISYEISKLDIFEDVKMLNFRDASESEFANLIESNVREEFMNACCNCSVVPTIYQDENAYNNALKNAGDLKIVYTPLHGTGLIEVVPVLQRNGFSNVIVVDEQAKPNGDFPTCPYPNPEMPDTLSLGLEYCKKNDADILIATDPDADRLGVAIKNNDEYVRLNGNEVGILLFNYLCESIKSKGEDLSNLVMVTTIVSTDITNAIAKEYGVEIRRTLTGFKNIGEQILHLEQNNEKDRFMFAFEESCGYLPGSHVRDKDGISASLIFCQMAALYKSQNKSLIDVLNSIYKKYGWYKNDQVSIEYPGVEGQTKMQNVLSSIRNNKPKNIAGLKVKNNKDYMNDTKMFVQGKSNNLPDELLPKSDVLEFNLESNCKIIVRPSGTEPKIKVYCFSYHENLDESINILNKLKSAAKDLLA